MKVRTSDLIGPALDWAVAKCEGWSIEDDFWITDPQEPGTGQPLSDFSPSTDWSQGGPIIEREGITVQTDPTDAAPYAWSAYLRGQLFSDDGSDCFRNGPTPLIAAMRCFVASRLGDEVDIPVELIKE